MNWDDVLARARACEVKAHRHLPPSLYHTAPVWNGHPPQRPDEILPPNEELPRTLFISESPLYTLGEPKPFFWSRGEDNLRAKLSLALHLAHQQMGDDASLTSAADIARDGFYLLPSFPYPFAKNNGDNWDPPRRVLQTTVPYLSAAMDYIQPRYVVLLGRRALWSAIFLGLVSVRKEDPQSRFGPTVAPYAALNPHERRRGVRAFAAYAPGTTGAAKWRDLVRTLALILSEREEEKSRRF